MKVGEVERVGMGWGTPASTGEWLMKKIVYQFIIGYHGSIL